MTIRTGSNNDNWESTRSADLCLREKGGQRRLLVAPMFMCSFVVHRTVHNHVYRGFLTRMVFLLYIMLEIHHSGWDPSIFVLFFVSYNLLLADVNLLLAVLLGGWQPCITSLMLSLALTTSQCSGFAFWSIFKCRSLILSFNFVGFC